MVPMNIYYLFPNWTDNFTGTFLTAESLIVGSYFSMHEFVCGDLDASTTWACLTVSCIFVLNANNLLGSLTFRYVHQLFGPS